MRAGEPIRCRHCGQPRLTLDYHYATCPRLEACLPIKHLRHKVKPNGKPPPALGRAYSQARRCPECGKWITDKARACKRHMALGKGRGRAFGIRRTK